MSEHFHALVWIDHQLAKVWYFNAEEAQETTVHSSHPHQHLHHKANTRGSGHVGVDTAFLQQVAASLEKAGAVLITGPANAKTELVAYLARAHPDLSARIFGVETLDHPTDGELLAFGRRFFRADDRLRDQRHRITK